MTINANRTDVIIPFSYIDEQTKDKYFIKYHHHENTPSVSFSDNEKDWIMLPANMFAEITDFLREKGILDRPAIKEEYKNMNELKKKEPSAPSSVPSVKAVVNNKEIELPLPEISSDEEDNEEKEFIKPLITADTPPLESFFGMEELAAKTTVHKEKKEEIVVDRPVIRSETDAAILRKSNEKKAIKRA